MAQRTEEYFCTEKFDDCARYQAMKVQGPQASLGHLGPWQQGGNGERGT